MDYTFVQPAPFVSEWKRLRLTDEDLQKLESLIRENPAAGPVMKGTGGLRKIRFAPPSWNQGKSGASRVCYVVFSEVQAIYFLAMFAKNEKSNLTPAEREFFRQWIAMIRADLKQGDEE
ncbi:MAG: hypothetical protein JWN51_1224 [Phycisphaerales bacterium]|nr:hypothetical protein [Phycisphaerales bacterium]